MKSAGLQRWTDRLQWQTYVARQTTARLAWRGLTAGRDRTILDEALLHRERFPPLPGRPRHLASEDARFVQRPAESRVYRFREPVHLEATFGYPIARDKVLLWQALPRASDAFQRRTLKYFSAVPSPRPPAMSPHKRLKRAISLRHVYESNFYHAMIDLLPSLALLERTVGVCDTPVLVGPGLWQRPFFQEARHRGELRHIHWVEHTADLVVDELLIALPSARDRNAMGTLRSMLDLPEPSQTGPRRVFIGRGARDGRRIVNWDEIHPVLARHDFVCVNPGVMSLAEQLQIFVDAEAVAGVHGAALANIAFCAPGSLRVLELFSPARLSPVYWELARSQGHAYRPLAGNWAESGDSMADFAVDANELEAALMAMLAGSAPNPTD